MSRYRQVGGDYPHTDLTTLVDASGVMTHKMCCICFEYVALADLFTDEHGQKWDMCMVCGVTEGY